MTRKFTKTRISPEYDGLVLYAKDAMDGLDIANKLMDKEHRRVYEEELAAFKGFASTPGCLAFRSDGKILAVGCEDGVIKLWDMETLFNTNEAQSPVPLATHNCDCRLICMTLAKSLK